MCEIFLVELSVGSVQDRLPAFIRILQNVHCSLYITTTDYLLSLESYKTFTLHLYITTTDYLLSLESS